MVWSAIALVAHHHADGAESSKCTVCVAAHTAVPTSPTLSPHTNWLVVFPVKTEPVVAAKQRLIAFALTVRPPPEF
jgi:hypothetical protein